MIDMGQDGQVRFPMQFLGRPLPISSRSGTTITVSGARCFPDLGLGRSRGQQKADPTELQIGRHAVLSTGKGFHAKQESPPREVWGRA